MKILHVTPTYSPTLGGAEHYLKEVSERLVARGHAVTVFTANVTDGEGAWRHEYAGFPEEEVINGVRVVRFDPRLGRLERAVDAWLLRRGGWRSLATLLSPTGLELLVRGPRTLDMIGALLRERSDIVASINWYWPSAYHAHLSRRIRRFRLVGIPLFHTTQAWCRRPVYDRMLAACDAVIALTSHEKSYAEGRGARTVDVVGAGVSPELFEGRDGASVRARYGLLDVPVVGYVGQQLASKGVAKLIEAMTSVWQWNPEVRLVLAGHSKPDDKVEAALARLSRPDRARVIQIGRFDNADKASIFDSFDVFAMPSREDSFGIVYLEAWLCHKPVIGARIGSTQCVIDDGRDGLLVDPDSAEDIAHAIVSLLANAELRTRMAQAGHAKAVTHYTWESVTTKIESLYRQVASSQS